MSAFKRDIYTKSFLLTLTPEQWKKLQFISRKNRVTVTEQLRKLIDYTINVYEKNMGAIEVLDDSPPKQ